jgi:hypothetical protein
MLRRRPREQRTTSQEAQLHFVDPWYNPFNMINGRWPPVNAIGRVRFRERRELLQFLRCDADDKQRAALLILHLELPFLSWSEIAIDILEYLAGNKRGFMPVSSSFANVSPSSESGTPLPFTS